MPDLLANPLTMTVEDVATRVLRQSVKTFRNKKSELYKLGFPAPLDIPGEMVWDRREIEAWLESRRQAVAFPRTRGGAGQARIAERNAEASAAAVKRSRGRPRKMEGGAA